MTVNKITNPPSQKDVIDKINEIIDNLGGSGVNLIYTTTCPALTSTDGVCTWTVTHNLGSQSIVTALYSGGNKIDHNTSITSNNAINVSFKASSNVTAGDFTIVVIAGGGSIVGADVDLANITDTAKSDVAEMAMPTNTHELITLGASGTSYTAPATGYFIMYATRGSSTYIDMYNASSSGLGCRHNFNASWNDMRAFLPAKKGDSVVVLYDGTFNYLDFRFVYAKGSESEAS